jgi:hypothetical protein
MIFKLFCEIKREGTLPNSLCEAVNGADAVCDQKTSKFFVSYGKNSSQDT